MAISKKIPKTEMEQLQELFKIRGMMTKCATDKNIHIQTIKRIKVLGIGEDRNIDAIVSWVRKNRKLLTDQKKTA